MKTFTEYLDEAKQPEWMVGFKKQKMNGVDISDMPVTVKARDTREAILKAAKKVGITDKSAAMQLKTKSVEKKS
jgi:PII-like signaling protein